MMEDYLGGKDAEGEIMEAIYEYDPTDDAEDRLAKIFEYLLSEEKKTEKGEGMV